MTFKKTQPLLSLDAALFEVAAAVPAIEHDMVTDHFGYVSAERMLEVVKAEMIKRGVMFRRQTSVNVVNRGNLVTSAVLTSKWTLTHPASGESRTDTTEWPFESRPEWPIEQAMAAALTSSMAYYLRDLGMVVRGVGGGTAPPMADDPMKGAARPRQRDLGSSEQTGALGELAAWLNGMMERANALNIDRQRILDAAGERINPNRWGDAATWTPEVRAWLEKFIERREELEKRRKDPAYKQDVEIGGKAVSAPSTPLVPHSYTASETDVNEPGYWQGKLFEMARQWMQSTYPDRLKLVPMLVAAAERAFSIPAPDPAMNAIAVCLKYRHAVVELETHPVGWEALFAQVS